MNFIQLSELLRKTSDDLVQRSVKAVNVNLTLRNWLFGYYIVEYEQSGEDRAKYGKNLLGKLSNHIKIKGLSETNLKICRQFYLTYPEILGVLPQEFKYFISSIEVKDIHSYSSVNATADISQTLSDEFNPSDNKSLEKSRTMSDNFNGSNAMPHLGSLLTTASFNHFIELIKIDDSSKRRFYELLILKTLPSVRELRRLVETLTFERVNLSGNPSIAFNELANKINPVQSSDLVKSHYFFEFLNINKPGLIEESELEQALIDHLQEFIIELGNGFCFEARQKRILIGDEYFFID